MTSKRAREAMSYPFDSIGSDGYEPDDIRQHIVVETPETEAPHGDFPNNIRNFVFYHEGENDVESWRCLGHLKSGAWFYYVAECDYTGFGCQGGMKLWVSHSLDNLLNHAVEPEDLDEIKDLTSR